MTRETKVGLLVGMGVILLIGIIVSDHLSVMQQQRFAPMGGFAEHAQESIGNSADQPAYPGFRDPHRALPDPRARHIEEAPVNIERRLPATIARDPFAREQSLPGAYHIEELPLAQRSPVQSERYAPETYNQTYNERYSERVDIETPAVPERIEPLPLPAPDRHTTVAEQVRRDTAEMRGIIHHVKAGETLYQIAEKYYSNGDYWRRLAEHNADVVQPNGQVRENVRLVIPNLAGLVNTGEFVPAGSERVIRLDVAPRTIEAQSGDTLSGLAARHLGSSSRWRELLDANRDQLDAPTDLRAGMKLKLPAERRVEPVAPSRERADAVITTVSNRGRTYTVRPGDSLTRIATRELGDASRVQELFQANRTTLKSPDALVVGQTLRLPE